MSTFLFYKVKSSTGRFLALLIACACWLPSRSQVIQQGNPLQLADQYFAAGEYYTAAHLYEQYLHPKKNTNGPVFPVYDRKRKGTTMPKGVTLEDILYRQAECYRLSNYWLNADSTYKKCADHVDALYWNAVCERSLGKYEEAEENVRKYLSSAGTNPRFKEAAEQELKTLQYIRKELARADSILVSFRKLNTPDGPEKGAYAAFAVGNNKYLISSTQTGTQQANGTTNPHHARLYYATLNNDSLHQLTAVSLPSDATPENQGAASVSADGNRIYYTQWKKVNGHIVSSIYYTTKQSNGSWSAPVLMPDVNASGFNSKQPFIAADGKYLYFASDRPGGSGGFDIWYAPLNTDCTTGKPVNAGKMINTASDEQAPFFHTSSNTLVFSTNGRQGMGGFDLFAAKGSEVTWTEPSNLGHPVNSSRDDIYFYAPENSSLLANAVIGSDRGFGCCLESYNIKKAGKRQKLSGIVHDCKNNSPVTDAVVTLTDPDGRTRTTSTDIEGRYSFDTINGYKDLTISISKAAFKDTSAAVSIGKTEETNLLVDLFFNADLCVDKKFVLKPENVVTVYFDFDKSVLKPEGIRKLDSLYNVMVENPKATLQVSGYTDGKGSNDYNAKLSDRRARTCANYLIQKGVDASRITFESFGACCPVEMELINGRDNPDGRSRNRRALINITKE